MPVSHRFKCNACRAEYFDTMPDGTTYAHVCGNPPVRRKKGKPAEFIGRDENTKVDKRGLVAGIKSQGTGVTCLTDGRLEEPAWISALYKHIAARE